MPTVKKPLKPKMPIKPAAKKDTKTAVKNPAPAPKKSTAQMEKLTAEMNKRFGANAVTLGFPKDDDGNMRRIERIPSGSFSLDIALGGGIPLGRFIQISGGYSSTKTTQSMHIIREAQKYGLTCALIDAENTSDEPYLSALGVDVDSLLYSNPDGMEEAFQMILDMQRSGEVHLAVLDSIAVLSPNKEQDTSMEDTIRMGIPQQLLGEFLRKYNSNNNRLKREGKRAFSLIGINQLREKIGAYGDPEYTPGGRAKEYYSSVDIRFRRGDWISEGTGENKEFVGQIVKFKIEKNKTFKRMQTGECDFYFAENSAGIPVFFNDNYKEVVMCGIEWGVIERTGAWFVHAGKKFQGLPALLAALTKDAALVNEIKQKVLYLSAQKG